MRKLKCNNFGSSIIVGTVILVILIVVVALLSRSYPPTSSIEVLGTLEPSTVNENTRSKLTLVFNNHDLKMHHVRVIFSASQHVLIYEGNEKLLDSDSYTFVLEAANPSEQRVFTVTGVLESGTLSAQYPVAYRVYADGDELPKSWNDPILTVQKH